MKKNQVAKTHILYVFLLIGCFLQYKKSFGQAVIHPYGSFCVGATNVFAYTGPGSVTSWTVGGNGIVTPNGSSIQVYWNSAVTNTYVTANYNTGWSTGSVSYNNITISASVTPSVSINVSNNNICQGTSVIFTATPVNGGTTPSYSWYINGSFISSGSSNTFSTSSLTNGQQVTCIMSTSVSCYTSYTAASNAITMTVNPTMTVTISGNTTICQGSQGSFVASITNGTGSISYQWKKNGANVSSDGIGVPPHALVLNSVNNNDVITCVATSSSCTTPATSNALTITITTPQTFYVSVSPTQISLCQNASVTFNATSTYSMYNYQWYMNGSPVSGATNSGFITSAISVSQLQSVSVTASTSAGCVTNTTASGNANSIPFVINPTVTPSVSIVEPSVVVLGSSAIFTANPTNASNPTYQWQLNGVNISGATTNTYTTTITSGDQYQSIGVIMNSNALCAINPATALKYVEIASVNWENLNYVRVHTVVAAGIANWIQADGLSTGDKFQSTTYLNGYAKPMQAVKKQMSQLESGAWTDLVAHIEYDLAGRAEKSFIPFSSSSTIGKFKTNAKSEQETFIRNKYGEDANSPTYTKSSFENNPLSRFVNEKAPGTAYGGDVNYSGVTTQYEYNTETEGVRLWNIGFAVNSVPYTNAIYPSGKLFKTIAIDDKLKKVYVYTDYEGKTILKKVQDKDAGQGLEENSHIGWLCTYYVYDDLGQLRSIITSKAVAYLQLNSWSFTNTDVYQELCYWYEFDERSRTIVKHSPGAGQIQMIYDKKDRLVLSQDENQRNRPSKQWSFFLYDEQDRNIVDGLFDHSANRNDLASHVKSLHNGSVGISIYTGGMEGITADNPVAGSANYCNNCSNTVINNVSYYDTYSFSGTRPFITSYSFASTTNPYVEVSTKSNRVLGTLTGFKTRVINQNYDDNNPNNDVFLRTMHYYDEKARPFQDIFSNIKSGENYTTLQYDFSNKLLSVYDKQYFNINYEVISKYEYNVIGQLTRLSKKYNSTDYKKIAEYTYDEYGRLRNKKLSPDYNSGAGIETLKYDYNIQGWLTGINKDYALTTSMLDQWDHFFGAYYGYDNRDNLFAAKQYDGKITGTIWKTQGDNMPRKYDYQYDNAGQFKAANFLQKQKATDATWNNANMDFSVTGVLYDENGNLLQMNQKGIIPGNNAPLFVDKLQYEYKQVAGAQWSNQLRKVFDQTTDLSSSNNGALGDFKDESFGTNNDDYTYDGNGNLTKDNNKKIRISSGAGVEYNFLSKPQKITIENKSVIEFIYDATGGKIGKKVTNTPTGAFKITWYNGDYIYEENNSVVELKMILHEEGRIRVYPAGSNPRITIGNNFDLPGTNVKGTFDFFVKDNLENVRMILTEETHSEYNNCTMETGNSYYEERMFGQVDMNNAPISGSNEVILTRKAKSSFASGWVSNTSASVSRLKQDEQKVGPNLILKVMAGDEINAQTKYYYTGIPDNTGSPGILNSILSTLLTTLTNTAPTVPLHNSGGNITTNYGTNPGDMGAFLGGQNIGGSTTPQAYLNILFFDENFNFIKYDQVTGLGSTGWRVGAGGDGQPPIIASNVLAPKNGYAFVYISNESKTAVYFDDLEVTHTRGRIIEENSYYPYGLKIKGISAKAFDKGENKYGYQGSFAEVEEETAWDEFDLRMYDPQIGRWTGVDPYDQFASPYIGMGNNPINQLDKDGGLSFGSVGAVIGAIGGSLAAYFIIKNNPQMSGFFKGLLAVGLPMLSSGLGYASFESLNNGMFNNYFGNGTEGKDWRNSSPHFIDNFRAFYAGILGKTEIGSMWGSRNIQATPPHLSFPEISIKFKYLLPKWQIWNRYGDDADRWNPRNYSFLGRQWRIFLSGMIPIYDYGVPHPFTLMYLAMLITDQGYLFPIFVWPTYQLLRHTIVKPIIRIKWH